MTRPDDDDINAMANRLRTNGWTAKPEPYFHASRVRPEAKSLMPVDAKVMEVARDLVAEYDGTWPIYQWVADEFGLSFDDAVRAVGEAKRLVGAAR